VQNPVQSIDSPLRLRTPRHLRHPPLRACSRLYETLLGWAEGSNKNRALMERASLFSEFLYVDQVLNSILYLVTNSPYLFYW
jgi:hypothetical protein